MPNVILFLEDFVNIPDRRGRLLSHFVSEFEFELRSAENNEPELGLEVSTGPSMVCP